MNLGAFSGSGRLGLHIFHRKCDTVPTPEFCHASSYVQNLDAARRDAGRKVPFLYG